MHIISYPMQKCKLPRNLWPKSAQNLSSGHMGKI
jgi:hypothetical protein